MVVKLALLFCNPVVFRQLAVCVRDDLQRQRSAPLSTTIHIYIKPYRQSSRDGEASSSLLDQSEASQQQHIQLQ